MGFIQALPSLALTRPAYEPPLRGKRSFDDGSMHLVSSAYRDGKPVDNHGKCLLARTARTALRASRSARLQLIAVPHAVHAPRTLFAFCMHALDCHLAPVHARA